MPGTTPTATKTRRTKIESRNPPRDICDNTKERRAWLARVLEEVNATPGREGKIVGEGSYQYVSVYEVTEVQGRLRHRGVCQFCGNSQVTDGVMVLHGYRRPGDGYVYGRCPGVGLKPLNQDKTHTEAWLAAAIKEETETRAAEEAAALEKQRASRRLHSLPEEELRAGFRSKPNKPPGQWVRLPVEQRDAYAARVKEWTEANPLHAAAWKAEKAHEAARAAHWRAQQDVRHFTALIESGVHGTPLQEEVVV